MTSEDYGSGGCQCGCFYCSEGGVMSPEYCHHPSFDKPRKIIGYSSGSCEIPEGETKPLWCPLRKPLTKFKYNLLKKIIRLFGVKKI